MRRSASIEMPEEVDEIAQWAITGDSHIFTRERVSIDASALPRGHAPRRVMVSAGSATQTEMVGQRAVSIDDDSRAQWSR